MGCLANGLDVVDQIGLLSAALAGWVDGEEISPQLLPCCIVSAGLPAWPLGVRLGLALPSRSRCLRAGLTRGVHLLATSADSGRAAGHQATGASPGWPCTSTTPAAMEVPPFFVMTVRT